MNASSNSWRLTIILGYSLPVSMSWKMDKSHTLQNLKLLSSWAQLLRFKSLTILRNRLMMLHQRPNVAIATNIWQRQAKKALIRVHKAKNKIVALNVTPESCTASYDSVVQLQRLLGWLYIFQKSARWRTCISDCSTFVFMLEALNASEYSHIDIPSRMTQQSRWQDEYRCKTEISTAFHTMSSQMTDHCRTQTAYGKKEESLLEIQVYACPYVLHSKEEINITIWPFLQSPRGKEILWFGHMTPYS